MKRMIAVAMVAGMILSAVPLSRAEMMPIPAGKVDTYDSSNGTFQARVTYGGFGSAGLELYKGDERVWSAHLPGHPGDVAVADNGQLVAITTFGWEDERGCDGLVLYNDMGDELRKIRFGGDLPDQGGLKWVDVLAIAADAKYVAVGEGLKETAQITLYDVATGDEVWVAEGGYQDTAGIAIEAGATRTLVATRKVSDMNVFLLDKEGAVVKQKEIKENFSYDVPVWVRFATGGEPEVFDLKSAAFVALN